MSLNKVIVLFSLIVVVIISGCIRHSDQRLPRKTNQISKEETKNIKRLTPNLIVNDINQTIDFYSKNIGFEPVLTYPQDASVYDFAILSKDDVDIMIQTKANFVKDFPEYNDKEIGGTFSLFIEVNNILAIYEKASMHTQIVKELHQTLYGSKEFSMKDNNGYLLTFSEALK